MILVRLLVLAVYLRYCKNAFINRR